MQPSFPLFVQLLRKQVVSHIRIIRHNKGNIFHIADVGVNVVVYLPDQLRGVFCGVFQDGAFCVPQGNDKISQERAGYQDAKGDGDGSPNAPKAHQGILFHLFRLSFAYSVGVFPVAFLKETLK